MDILEAAPGLYGIQIPIPSPLAHVNCYLARGPHGWTLIDTGFHTPEAESGWAEALRRLGITWSDVEQIIVTHYHPDHYGAAGWLQQQTGAPVIMHEPEATTARRVWAPEATEAAAFGRAMAELVREHGLPEDRAETLTAFRSEAWRRTQPAPMITPIREGDRISAGGRTFEILCTPGHTDGLIVMWDPTDQILLADDMVLAPISPNISVNPAAAGNPLADYLASLDRIAAIPARLTFTGHRSPITDLATRCAELTAHHHQRLEGTLALVDGLQTAWEVAQGLFARQINSPATMMFALGETIAHLEFLRYQGAIERRRDDDGCLRYVRP